MVNVSKKLKDAVRTHEKPAFEIAYLAGLHPSTVSQLINELVRVNEDDERVTRIGEVVGVSPGECFE